MGIRLQTSAFNATSPTLPLPSGCSLALWSPGHHHCTTMKTTLFVALLLLAPLVSGKKDKKDKKGNKELNDRVTKLEEQMEGLGEVAADVELLKDSNGDQDSEITSLKESNGAQDSEITSLKDSKGDQDSEIASLKDKNGDQDSEITSLKAV